MKRGFRLLPISLKDTHKISTYVNMFVGMNLCRLLSNHLPLAKCMRLRAFVCVCVYVRVTTSFQIDLQAFVRWPMQLQFVCLIKGGTVSHLYA